MIFLAAFRSASRTAPILTSRIRSSVCVYSQLFVLQSFLEEAHEFGQFPDARRLGKLHEQQGIDFVFR